MKRVSRSKWSNSNQVLVNLVGFEWEVALNEKQQIAGNHDGLRNYKNITLGVQRELEEELDIEARKESIRLDDWFHMEGEEMIRVRSPIQKWYFYVISF